MMTVEQKQKLFIDEYALYGWDIAGCFKYLSLTGAIYVAAKKKDPNMTVFALLKKIMPEGNYNRLFEVTQYHIMGHLYSTDTKFPTYGYASAKDMIAEIKRLLDEWLPF